MTRISVILAIVGIGIASAFAEFPVGHWSNKKQGFEVVNFGLRADGGGYFSASMSQSTTVVRWENDGDTIRIKIAAPPENPTFVFLPTDDPKVGRLKIPNLSSQEFYLVNEDEPEDLEAQAKVRAEEENAKEREMMRKSLLREEVTVTGLKALLEQVEQFAEVTEGTGFCFIKANDWPTVIQLNRFNKRISITVCLELGQAKELSPNLTSRYTTEEPKSDLPRTVFVSTKKREELRKWAAGMQLKHRVEFREMMGTWGLEEHSTSFYAHIDEDPEKVADVIKYISETVFDENASEFVITHVTRIGEQAGADRSDAAAETKPCGQ